MSLTTAKEALVLMISKKLCALQFAYENKSYEENFKTLQDLLSKTPENSLSLAPELCLSAYSYGYLEEAAYFGACVFPRLLELSKERSFGLTMVEKTVGGYANVFKLFHNGKVFHSQAKAKLFPLGDEPLHFKAGKLENIAIFELGGIKIAVLICFELRFTALWEQIKGADLILVPAYWGQPRKNHFEALTTALAIANQAFVLCANSSDEAMAKGSGIVSPFGEALRDDTKAVITQDFDFKEIKKMRRYLDIGLGKNAPNSSL